MMMKSTHDSPILVTGAAGAIGAIGRNLTTMLLAKGHKVRALVRREDERADALRRLGAEVVQGDLTGLASMHRAIEGCARIYFGISVSAVYLEATVNTAAVARHHGPAPSPLRYAPSRRPPPAGTARGTTAPRRSEPFPRRCRRACRPVRRSFPSTLRRHRRPCQRARGSR